MTFPHHENFKEILPYLKQSHDLNTKLQFLSSTLHKTNIPNIRVWSKERFIDQENANREDGGFKMLQIQLAHWTELGFLSTKPGMGVGIRINAHRFQSLDETSQCRRGEAME